VKPKLRGVPLAQLVLDEKNASKGTKRGRELLGQSLERYGAGRSVVVDCHTLPISLVSYDEILRGWKDEGDRYTHEQIRNNTLFRCAVLKDSGDFKRIKSSSTK